MDLSNEHSSMVEQVVKEVLRNNKLVVNEWLSLDEASKYIGVSFNTLKKLRERGLQVSEVEGTSIKRVSRKELDRFMNLYMN